MKQPSVSRMLRSMTAKELLDWRAYEALEPFRFNSELRADYRAAQIVTALANIHRGEKKSAYKLAEFLMKFDEDMEKVEQKVPWQELQRKALMIVDIYNAAGLTDPLPER